tara:strand:+ start:490 stop:717 length:228 start_codon:yes stop_codon:yes gene_type:complete
MNKEKQFTSYDSQGPTDFDIVGFHLDTIKDMIMLIDICQNSLNMDDIRESIPSSKLDELRHYVEKLKRYIKKDEN